MILSNKLIKHFNINKTLSNVNKVFELQQNNKPY